MLRMTCLRLSEVLTHSSLSLVSSTTSLLHFYRDWSISAIWLFISYFQIFISNLASKFLSGSSIFFYLRFNFLTDLPKLFLVLSARSSTSLMRLVSVKWCTFKSCLNKATFWYSSGKIEWILAIKSALSAKSLVISSGLIVVPDDSYPNSTFFVNAAEPFLRAGAMPFFILAPLSVRTVIRSSILFSELSITWPPFLMRCSRLSAYLTW